jgi:hypothetical protein
MGTQAGCALTTILLFGYYVWQNKKRNQAGGSGSDDEDRFMSPEVWARKTDKENRNFRYTY